MCNCKYGCCAVCSYGTCYGVCCSDPPATCGCGNDLTSGETCLNTTYYVYSSSCTNYYQFSFQYVIFIPTNGEPPLDDALLKFIIWVYSLPTSYDWLLTTDSSTVSDLHEYLCQPFIANAKNCYMWESDIYLPAMPFTSYDLSGCSSSYPSYVCSCDYEC
jgi:hypothetical protein